MGFMAQYVNMSICQQGQYVNGAMILIVNVIVNANGVMIVIHIWKGIEEFCNHFVSI